MALIKELFKDKVRIVIILLGALLGFYLAYRHKPIESYSHKMKPLRDPLLFEIFERLRTMYCIFLKIKIMSP